ncbi:lantibiotic dehydratase C-terminal domain-containing protein [Streptomyces chrestomyceticus]|uniref:lantibiotic dehydratase C-terminal domain-containing protein n=1 Tax=Streptomyces chrestomyceticus TaxID=68185 RepID=UPI0037887DF0
MAAADRPLDPATADASDWVCAHVFRDTGHDALLTGCLRPLVKELTADGLLHRYFFLRYWEGGPHVRMRFLPTGTAASREVRQRVATAVGAFLRERPAPDTVDRARYAGLAGELAALEDLSEHDRELRPNNSVEFLPYLREHAVYGHGPAMAATEQHFHESSELTLALIAAGTTGQQRAAVALDLMLAVLALCDELRAQWVDSGQPLIPFAEGTEPAATEEHYLARREHLRERALRVWQLAPDPAGATPQAHWLRSLRTLRDRLSGWEDAGTFTSEWARSPLNQGGPDLAALPHPATTLILLRCAHLANNRLGLTLSEENHLRFLAGRIVTDLPSLPVR